MAMEAKVLEVVLRDLCALLMSAPTMTSSNVNPMNYKGTEGVVGLTQWFKRMETVFHNSNCAVENQVKFATCTLLGVVLTWWNSHVKTVGHDAAYGMP
ncbi:hypothetical protein Tco_0825151 [Tanacetum coccineum]